MPIKIYVDQGHNPRDYNTGAEGNGYFEQDITYNVGMSLYRLLSADPRFEARLSRPDEDTVLGFNNASSLTERVRAANSFGADLFLSIHTNASENSDAGGTEALVYSRESPIANGVARDILERVTLASGFRNRGIIERPGLYVLRRTAMPAVLLELGFISNPEEARLMSENPNLFARAIYNGIVDYYFG